LYSAAALATACCVLETRPSDVEQILLRLLRESNSATISGVVASVTTAYPEVAGAAAIALLTSSDFVRLDKMRTIAEAGAPSRMQSMFPRRADQRFYDEEREESDRRGHRLWDLEWTAIRLQQTAWRESIERLIDTHRSQLPPPASQSNNDRIWRIALHRMDLRGYTAEIVPAEESSGNDSQMPAGTTAANSGTRVRMQSAPFETDIQAMLDRNAPAENAERQAMSLFMWGVGVFQRTGPAIAATEWRARLVAARMVPSENPGDADPSGIRFRDRGVEFVAAVCVRDHWDELIPEERDWCFDTVCHCISIGAVSTDELHSIQRGGMDSSRAAAFVVPLLLTKPLSDDQNARATDSLAIGLTHAADEVKDYAVAGVREYLWQADADLCRVCVGAIARAARWLDEQLEQQRNRPWQERESSQQLEQRIAATVRREIVERRVATEDDVRLESGDWYACHFGLRTLRMLDGRADEPLARAAYANAVQLIVNVWLDEENRTDRRDFHWESDCELQFARYALCIPTSDALALIGPILDALPDQTKEVASIVQDLVIAEEDLKLPISFWPLWQAIADRACQTTWTEELDSRYSEHDEMLRKLFLNMAWNEGVRHWDALDGNEGRLVRLFNTLPATAAVLDAFVTYLYSVGSKSLPWAFVPIAHRLASGDAQQMLTLPNSVLGLEILLRQYVYAIPAILKSKPELRQAILQVLDELVEAGSRAYRMRDDFVTPSPPAAS